MRTHTHIAPHNASGKIVFIHVVSIHQIQNIQNSSADSRIGVRVSARFALWTISGLAVPMIPNDRPRERKSESEKNAFTLIYQKFICIFCVQFVEFVVRFVHRSIKRMSLKTWCEHRIHNIKTHKMRNIVFVFRILCNAQNMFSTIATHHMDSMCGGCRCSVVIVVFTVDMSVWMCVCVIQRG